MNNPKPDVGDMSEPYNRDGYRLVATGETELEGTVYALLYFCSPANEAADEFQEYKATTRIGGKISTEFKVKT